MRSAFAGKLRLRPALGAGCVVKFPAVAGGGNEAGADDVIAEMLAVLPLARISGEHRLQGGKNRIVIEILGVEFRHARAVERGAEIEIVAARTLADEGDLGEVRPRAAVRAAGHTAGDVVVGKPVRVEPAF